MRYVREVQETSKYPSVFAVVNGNEARARCFIMQKSVNEELLSEFQATVYSLKTAIHGFSLLN